MSALAEIGSRIREAFSPERTYERGLTKAIETLRKAGGGKRLMEKIAQELKEKGDESATTHISNEDWGYPHLGDFELFQGIEWGAKHEPEIPIVRGWKSKQVYVKATAWGRVDVLFSNEDQMFELEYDPKGRELLASKQSEEDRELTLEEKIRIAMSIADYGETDIPLPVKEAIKSIEPEEDLMFRIIEDLKKKGDESAQPITTLNQEFNVFHGIVWGVKPASKRFSRTGSKAKMVLIKAEPSGRLTVMFSRSNNLVALGEDIIGKELLQSTKSIVNRELSLEEEVRIAMRIAGYTASSLALIQSL